MPIYIFYKIFCKDENIKDLYVGKTTDLNKRWYCHKSLCNNQNRKQYNLKLYEFIRENGNINNWNIIEIEKGEYDDKDSAIREKYWIKNLNSNLNIVIPTRTHKEYRENNKEYLKEYKKEYRDNHKEYCKEYYKEYRDKNKEEYKEYCKEYRENNKEYYKKYRDNHKEELHKKAGERLICEICGKTFTKGGKSQHYKTKFHQKYIIE